MRTIVLFSLILPATAAPAAGQIAHEILDPWAGT